MITLHHLKDSRSQRILWLLEYLELPYELKIYFRNSDTGLAPDQLKKIHPLGKSPIISDDEKIMAESAAIIEYLIDRYGEGKIYGPKQGKDYRTSLYWMHFAEASLLPPLLIKLIFDTLSSKKVPFLIRPIMKKISLEVEKQFYGPNIKNNFEMINSYLSENEWFSGKEMGGADIQMSFPLEAGLSKMTDSSNYQNIKKYLNKIHILPSYQRALEKGGDYAYAKQNKNTI
jgi:glutathione S-transferase